MGNMTDTFFAVQSQKQETTHDIAKAILDMAMAQAVRFTKLDMLGELVLGASNYIKFRVDSQEITSVLEALRQQQKRGIIWECRGSFQAVLVDGRKGDVSISKMLTWASGAVRTYRGTKVAHWQEQFKLPN